MDLESLFAEQKKTTDATIKAREMSDREKAICLEKNVNFAIDKLSFIAKFGGKFLRFNTGLYGCWIHIQSPRFGNIGGFRISGESELNDDSILKQDLDKNSGGMSWKELAVAIGKKF